jgi:putative SOS response-associated peptidase YedK
MCFTVSIFSQTHVIETDTGALFDDADAYTPFFHVSGFTHPHLPFITNHRPEALEMVSWGLVPAWVKNAEAAADLSDKTLNARSDTIFEKPSFRSAIAQRRGLLPLDGFVEWRHEDKYKQPYFVRSADGHLLTLGCIWEDWTDRSSGEVTRSFSIVTTDANELMAFVHNSKLRMPVVIPPAHRSVWLMQDNREAISRLMSPLPEHLLEAVPIKKAMSSIKDNRSDPTLIEGIAEPLR